MTPSNRFAELLQYVEGELTVTQAQKLEAELAQSPALRGELAHVRQLTADLGDVVPGLDGVDLVPELHRLTGAPAPRPRRRWAMAGVALAAAAGLAVGVVSWQQRSSAEFQVRGSGDAAAKWVGLEVFQHDHSPLGEVLHPSQGIAFVYRNTGPHPFSHLMVFARDASGRVFWFYPEWTDARADPVSIPVGASDGAIELRELVSHPYQPGGLTLHALFTRRPLHVSEVEALLKEPRGDELQLPDSVDLRRALRVER